MHIATYIHMACCCVAHGGTAAAQSMVSVRGTQREQKRRGLGGCKGSRERGRGSEKEAEEYEVTGKTRANVGGRGSLREVTMSVATLAKS